jgi:hypothetical protein
MMNPLVAAMIAYYANTLDSLYDKFTSNRLFYILLAYHYFSIFLLLL